ncbi:hypothetical protein VPH35_039786 [Triticum aestivum]
MSNCLSSCMRALRFFFPQSPQPPPSHTLPPPSSLVSRHSCRTPPSLSSRVLLRGTPLGSSLSRPSLTQADPWVEERNKGGRGTTGKGMGKSFMPRIQLARAVPT